MHTIDDASMHHLPDKKNNNAIIHQNARPQPPDASVDNGNVTCAAPEICGSSLSYNEPSLFAKHAVLLLNDDDSQATLLREVKASVAGTVEGLLPQTFTKKLDTLSLRSMSTLVAEYAVRFRSEGSIYYSAVVTSERMYTSFTWRCSVCAHERPSRRSEVLFLVHDPIANRPLSSYVAPMTTMALHDDVRSTYSMWLCTT